MSTAAAKKRLTSTPGYDGGAFFSRDGNKMVWRAHHPAAGAGARSLPGTAQEDLTAPMKMELFVANADGSGAKQITNFGCASFAPQFTPDGKRIIFASNKNKCDSREFELFLIDIDGGNLEQMTSFRRLYLVPGFLTRRQTDRLHFEPEAKSPYEFNIFVADWK